jgi:hypothetical protein
LPAQPGNVGGSDPKERLGRLFQPERADTGEIAAVAPFLSK